MADQQQKNMQGSTGSTPANSQYSQSAQYGQSQQQLIYAETSEGSKLIPSNEIRYCDLNNWNTQSGMNGKEQIQVHMATGNNFTITGNNVGAFLGELQSIGMLRSQRFQQFMQQYNNQFQNQGTPQTVGSGTSTTGGSNQSR